MRKSLLSISLIITATGILTQALLAGFFLSGTSGARTAHVFVGWLLPYFAIIPMVAAWREVSRGELTRLAAVGATLLLVGLWVQEFLGHMPFPVTTAIHVPWGVCLFGLASLLAYSTSRETNGSSQDRQPG